jgi:hypothetical protein
VVCGAGKELRGSCDRGIVLSISGPGGVEFSKINVQNNASHSFASAWRYSCYLS